MRIRNQSVPSGFQQVASPFSIARRTPSSRVSELAQFAARINRALKVEIEQDIVVLTPGNDLTTLRYQEIHLEAGRISDLLRHGGFPNLIINLGECQHLENVILTALVGFCRSVSGKAAFCCASEEIQQLMWNANLLNLWRHYSTRSEAIDAMH